MSQIFAKNVSWFRIKKHHNALVDSAATEMKQVDQEKEDLTPRIYTSPTCFFKHVFLKVIYLLLVMK